jgi:hypothetical protein
METGAMPEGERVSWCRKKGVFSHHLEQWKKELNRKDKALAETAPCWFLKKKQTSSGGIPGTTDQ